MLVVSSPKLFADYHVLLRLLPPRHPPTALLSLDHIISIEFTGTLSIVKEHLKIFIRLSLGGASRD